MAFIALRFGCRNVLVSAKSQLRAPIALRPKLLNQFVAEKSTFADLGLEPALVEELAKVEIVTPTKVQELAIPTMFEAERTHICDQTGSGKTLCYLLPLLNSIIKSARRKKPQQVGSLSRPDRHLKGVVIAANALLVAQICEVFNTLGQKFNVSAAPLYPHSRLRLTSNTALLVTTLDSLGRHGLRQVCENLDMVVVDNVFTDSLVKGSNIYKHLEDMLQRPRWAKASKYPHIVLLSATLHPRASGCVDFVKWMKKLSEADFNRIILSDAAYHVPQNMSFRWTTFKEDMKMQMLVHALRVHGRECGTQEPRVLVHCANDKEVGEVAQALESVSDWYQETDADIDDLPVWWQFQTAAVSHLSTAEGCTASLNAVARFRNGEACVLVSQGTDLAGVDVPDTSAVVLWDFDSLKTVEEFLDISGRTARMGKKGLVVCLLSQSATNRSIAATLLHEVITVDPQASLSAIAHRYQGDFYLPNKYIKWQRILRAAKSRQADQFLLSPSQQTAGTADSKEDSVANKNDAT